ncbi:hypothetical protein BHE74_00059470 [Ensete ventricosum]|nr:hypothetical protein BHE74_00059470 [Ensete ventricosum]
MALLIQSDGWKSVVRVGSSPLRRAKKAKRSAAMGKMQCVSPLTAQAILPTAHNARLPSPRPFFPSYLATTPTISSFVRSGANSKAHFTRFTPPASVAGAEALDTLSGVEQAEGKEEVEAKQLVGRQNPLFPPISSGAVVKPPDKPRLVLRFIWMEKNIGLALDQVIPGHGTVPLSPYYFWPRKDAWEELKSKIEEKPWISQKRMIILLNQATDIINLWQQSGGNL